VPCWCLELKSLFPHSKSLLALALPPSVPPSLCIAPPPQARTVHRDDEPLWFERIMAEDAHGDGDATALLLESTLKLKLSEVTAHASIAPTPEHLRRVAAMGESARNAYAPEVQHIFDREWCFVLLFQQRRPTPQRRAGRGLRAPRLRVLLLPE
jgi:hypothetical protein